ncbi:MAG: cell division protein FtsZ, partial [Brevundimonas sp.]|nr:cell division protein FtsZ [Brevundimonas sp.]
IAELQRYVDTLIVIPNQNLLRVANERTTFADAFGMADQVLHSGVRSITDLMILPGLINLDFADVRAVMSEMGKAMMGTGEAEGDDRALMAAQNAIANPLLDETSLKGAKAVLVNITGGMDMTLLEVDEAANAISAEVDPDANIIFGAAFDPALDGKIRVSVVATGMDEEVMAQTPPSTLSRPLTTGRPAPRVPEREPQRAPEPVIRAAESAPVTPTFEPTIRTAEPRIHPQPQAPEPVAKAEAPRTLDPIVDPWVEEYEADQTPRTATRPVQGDLYMEPAREPARAERQPEPEPEWDDRDHHRKSGWSLFGRKRPAPEPAPYAPEARTEPRPMRLSGNQALKTPEPEPSEEDELEIPSFLRRLAN